MRQSHEVTHEWHRVGAVHGQVLDADGTTILYDFFEEFGITEDVANFNLALASFDTKAASTAVIRLIKQALGGTTFSTIHAMCGDNFFDTFVAHPTVRAAFERWQENSFAREQQNGVGGFTYAGITWENYTGGIGDVEFFDTDSCRFFPTGVPDLFREIPAPANFVETVNTLGRPVYAKQEKKKWGMGIDMHTQSNILMMCNRPKCLVGGALGSGSGSASSTSASA